MGECSEQASKQPDRGCQSECVTGGIVSGNAAVSNADGANAVAAKQAALVGWWPLSQRVEDVSGQSKVARCQ